MYSKIFLSNTHLSNFEFYNFIKKNKLKKLLLEETSFIKIDNVSLSERFLYIKNDIYEQAKCPYCGNYSHLKEDIAKSFCSRKCYNSYIDPKTGISNAQMITKKAIHTKNNTINGDGLNIHQEVGKRNSINLKIPDKNGLSTYDKIGIKTKNKKSQIDPDTGLTGYQKAGIKIKESMSKIDPDTGLTGYEKAGINYSIYYKHLHTKNKKNKIDKFKKTFYENHYNKKKEKILSDHDVKLITDLEDFIDNNYYLKYKCNKCNSIFTSGRYIRCTNCYPYNISIGENEVLEFCQSITNNVISNTRSVISPLEIDIYIPNYKLAIEYNGLYYHSSDSIESENKNYHLIKTHECKGNNIQLFHIFENEWLDPIKQEIWKSIIRNKLGHSEKIFARKTEIRIVNTKDKSKFLNENHLQGDCPSSINFGLYYENELISLMTFGKSRFSKKYDWELLRFCNKSGYSVIGGASRLLSVFKKEKHGSVVSYADLRRSDGNLYKQLGFKLSHESGPNYWYYKNPMILESRIKYQKHKLSKLLENYDSELTESENMYNNGYRKIYDCGNQVWIFE